MVQSPRVTDSSAHNPGLLIELCLRFAQRPARPVGDYTRRPSCLSSYPSTVSDAILVRPCDNDDLYIVEYAAEQMAIGNPVLARYWLLERDADGI